MCGIAGVLSFNNSIEEKYIRLLTDIIDHRGPDDFGYLAYNSKNKHLDIFKSHNTKIKANLFFGHRRLSILDLSMLGHQPMSYLNEQYFITYNGEVYNYLEIRDQLSNKGYYFNSNTDTEVILAAYHEWGEECVHHFNGMWSFAILDIKNNMIFCSRDRLGIKPFYYTQNGSYFAFGSEIKQLLLLDWVNSDVDQGIIFDYLALGAYGGGNERTFFKHIKTLMGGYNLIIDLNSGIIRKKQYWDIDIKNQNYGKSDKQYAKEFYNIFYDAVNIRMRSDVPLGTALSGGLDSSGIVVTVNEILKKNNSKHKQLTFTSVTNYEKYDESEYAKLIINDVNSKAFFTQPDPIYLFKNLKKIVWHHDEPFAGTSIYAGWKISELVRESGVTVTLDGQGPDEMMGGYFPFSYLLANYIIHLNFIKYLKTIKNINNLYNDDIISLIRKSFGIITYNFIPLKYRPNIRRAMKTFHKDFFYEGYKNSVILNSQYISFSNDLFTNYLYKAVKFEILPGILKQVDRNSMAFSVESRVPFLDHRLVEYVFSLPNDQKINKGVTKYVYRNALKGKMNDAILNRLTKLGFVSGEQEWVNNERYKNIMSEQLSKSQCQYFNSSFLKEIKYSLDNKNQFNPLIWKIINTSMWIHIFS